jgi:hypothetical protein
MVSSFMFQVSGSRIEVVDQSENVETQSGFGFRINGFKFHVSHEWFQVSCFKFQVREIASSPNYFASSIKSTP